MSGKQAVNLSPMSAVVRIPGCAHRFLALNVVTMGLGFPAGHACMTSATPVSRPLPGLGEGQGQGQLCASHRPSVVGWTESHSLT